MIQLDNLKIDVDGSFKSESAKELVLKKLQVAISTYDRLSKIGLLTVDEYIIYPSMKVWIDNSKRLFPDQPRSFEATINTVTTSPPFPVWIDYKGSTRPCEAHYIYANSFALP